ncbi:MAG: hypothetical protein OXG98_14600 [Gemmatimonadetes bacterium]|nr:hypothetical protein [Gemmatimonadota bacterium]
MTQVRHDRPTWAGRIPRHKIAELYKKDALGICDEVLIDDVGIGLLVRIENIFRARAANSGLASCALCHGEIAHDFDPAFLLCCESCNWELSWEEYHKSIRGKHLIASGMDPYLKEYVEQYRVARSPQEKMILIDTLIHRYHWELEGGLTGPGARDLIGGKTSEIIDFLNHLSYGAQSSSEILSTRQEWLDKVRRSQAQYASAVTERERKAEEKRQKAEEKKRRSILKTKARRARVAGQNDAGQIRDAT